MTYDPIPGQPHHPTEEETMSVIRAVLTEAQEQTPTRKAKRTLRQPQTPSPAMTEEDLRAFVERTVDTTVRRRASDLPELEEQDLSYTAPVTPRVSRLGKLIQQARSCVATALVAVRDFRPTTRHLALVSMALLVVLRPHWFVISGVLIVGLVVGTFTLLGSDRIWHGVLAWLNRVERRNPERALRMRARLDRFACRWDAILDVFPDGMVDGLYMPDLQAMEHGEEAHIQAMSARLHRMVHE